MYPPGSPPLPSLRAPSCFGAGHAPPRLRMFASVFSLPGLVLPSHPDSGHPPPGQRGGDVHRNALRSPASVPRGEGACTYCNIQSIVKNLFKARGGLRGRGRLPAPQALSTCAWAWFIQIAIKHRCTSQSSASVYGEGASPTEGEVPRVRQVSDQRPGRAGA